MQREVGPRRSADIPAYSCPPRIHLDPDFVRNSIKTVLKRQGYEGDIEAAAGRIEEKCRKATAKP